MTNEELISLGLTPEQASAVIGKLQLLEQDLVRAREMVAERERQIDGLKSMQGDNRALHKQIELLQAQNKEAEIKYKSDLLASRKSYAVRQALLESEHKPEDADIVMGLIDMDKVFMDDRGTLTGLQEQQARLVAEKAFLFKPSQNQGVTARNGFEVHGAGAGERQDLQPQKAKMANAEFGQKLAAITLQSQGLSVPNNISQGG